MAGASHDETQADGDREPARADERQPAAATEVAAGALVGRYVLQRRIGSGAMGVVYAAHDPGLDRIVALKVVHPERVRGDDEVFARMRREARAMARLQHPNVVGVLDVAWQDDRLCIAMELVEGESLGSWLRAETRDWRAILDVFLQAGEGLVAAHERGLVHRDFKPDNVLLDAHGCAKVGDFGLARLDDEPAPPAVPPADAAGDEHLTTTGSVMGTPAYMPPEAIAGMTVDEAGDQFSFCVSLYEALARQRPFTGRTLAELFVAIGEHRLAPVAATSTEWRACPERVRAAVLRGLAADPRRRWPSMAVLVGELRRARTKRSRRHLVALGLAGLVVAAIAATAAGDDVDCDAVAAQARGLWDARRGQIAAAADDTARRVDDLLEAYVAEWTVARDSVCRARGSDGSPESRDAAALCLADRLRAIEAATDALTHADAASERAVAMVSGLPPVADCGDPAWLDAQIRPPQGPDARAHVEQLRSRVAALEARLKLNEDIGDELDELAIEVADADYDPLTAELLVARSLKLFAGDAEAATRIAQDAFFVASRAGHHPVAVRAASDAVRGLVQLQRPLEARAWIHHATAALGPVADDPLLRAQVATARGLVENSVSEYAAARDAHLEALALRREALGDAHVLIAESLNDLGNAHFYLRESDRAEAYYREALAMYAIVLGASHPDYAITSTNLATTIADRRPDEALELLQRALVVIEASDGPASVRAISALRTMGGIHFVRGEAARAEELYRRTLDIETRAYGDASVLTALSRNNLAAALLVQGETDAAQRELVRAVGIVEEQLGPDSEELSRPLKTLGEIQLEQGRYEAAISSLARALAIMERIYGEDEPGLGFFIAPLGRALRRAGRPAEAVALLERSVTTMDRDGYPALEQAADRFELACALVDVGGDRARAGALAREAIAAWEGGPPRQHERARGARAWLAEHGLE